jgi:hypothetical protein
VRALPRLQPPIRTICAERADVTAPAPVPAAPDAPRSPG